MKVFYKAMYLDFRNTNAFGRFPGFDNFSFWCGGLSEW